MNSESLSDPNLEKDTKLAFRLFLLYLVSFFLHIPARIPLLGLIRFDMILVALIFLSIFFAKSRKKTKLDEASKYLLSIFLFSIVSLPLVEWPGSVLGSGLTLFIKGAIFYFFSVNLILNESRLKLTIIFFVSLNVLRVVEPLFLNLTTGYLGSSTHLGDGEFAGRLSGAPSDTINPNGLAFVIASVIPFLHYILFPLGKKAKALYFILIPVLLTVMLMTLSRSGMLAVLLISFGIFIKSKRKFLLIFIAFLGVFVIYSNMTDIQKDRYLSLVSSNAKQSETAEGRIDGWFVDFKVAMNRPIIGHGLGTSREANWNVAGKDQISHILWAEIWQEIGLIGLVLFVLYVRAMVRNFRDAGRLISQNLDKDSFLFRLTEAMQVWLLMNVLFSLASYGLKSYEWYFFGGLSVVLLNIVKYKLSVTSGLSSTNALGSEKRQAKFVLAKAISDRTRIG